MYRENIEKYEDLAAKRLKAVFDAVPGQLSKQLSSDGGRVRLPLYMAHLL